MTSNDIDGVIFHCDNKKAAERARILSLTVKRRNDFKYTTCRIGKDLIVHKPDVDIFEAPILIESDLRGKINMSPTSSR